MNDVYMLSYLDLVCLFCFASLYGCAEQSHGLPQAEKATFCEAEKKRLDE